MAGVNRNLMAYLHVHTTKTVFLANYLSLSCMSISFPCWFKERSNCNMFSGWVSEVYPSISLPL